MRVHPVIANQVQKSTKILPQKTGLNTSIVNLSDSFVRKEKQITFTGFRKNQKRIENRTESDLSSSLNDTKIKGTPFLLGLATSIAMVKLGAVAENLLFDKDGFIVSDNGIKSDMVNIDAAQGIIKFEGTGIEIKADDYDVVDWDNGIFRNYDGSVDIDLSSNKFIDAESGIFVDPEAKISAVLDGDRLQNIAIPHFGSGYPLFPWGGSSFATTKSKDAKTIEEEAEVYKNYVKSVLHSQDGDLTPQDTNIKDIFGNSIIAATDKDGDRYLASYSPEIDDNSVFAPFKKMFGTETVAETVNNVRLKSYMDENFPTFGTRIQVYEGGRNAGIPPLLKEYEQYDRDAADVVMSKISQDSSYSPEPGSDEAINFLKFQNHMRQIGIWKESVIEPNTLLDIDGDEISDIDIDGDGIPDYDIDGDGIIDLSSEQNRGVIGQLIYMIKTHINN